MTSNLNLLFYPSVTSQPIHFKFDLSFQGGAFRGHQPLISHQRRLSDNISGSTIHSGAVSNARTNAGHHAHLWCSPILHLSHRYVYIYILHFVTFIFHWCFGCHDLLRTIWHHLHWCSCISYTRINHQVNVLLMLEQLLWSHLNTVLFYWLFSL